MILNAFLFVSFFRGLEFWELKFRSRSFLYRQVLFGAAFSAHFASKDQSAAVTITIDRFSDVASLCCLCHRDGVTAACHTQGRAIGKLRFCVL